jgi:hypothetical protein
MFVFIPIKTFFIERKFVDPFVILILIVYCLTLISYNLVLDFNINPVFIHFFTCLILCYEDDVCIELVIRRGNCSFCLMFESDQRSIFICLEIN